MSDWTFAELVLGCEQHAAKARFELADRLTAMETACGIKTVRNVTVPLDPLPGIMVDGVERRNRELVAEINQLRRALRKLFSAASTYEISTKDLADAASDAAEVMRPNAP